MKENEKVIGTDKRAPGGVDVNVLKVDGEDRLLAVVEVRGGAYARLKAIADTMHNDDIMASPSLVFGSFIEKRLDDLNIGIDEGTCNVIEDVVTAYSEETGIDFNFGEVERAVLKSLD